MGKSLLNQYWQHSEAQVAQLYAEWEKESVALNRQRKEKKRPKRQYSDKPQRGPLHG